MIFKRKIYEKLLEWKKECNGEKCLLIEGARRIGKSTIVEEFAKNEYESYIMIDFSNAKKVVLDAFDYINDLDTMFMILSTEYKVDLKSRKSLLIFDEIQKFPKARESLKFLVKDGRFDYIETGSLISIRENTKDILIPSEERSINMYPMDFEEFAWAFGEEKLIELIKNCFEKRVPLERDFHNKAMLLFKQYMLVGGMPKPLDSFLNSARNFNKADSEKRDILSLYRNDIMKIQQKYQSKVSSLFDQIPAFLSQHEKRVVFDSVEKSSYSNQYNETLFWLGDSKIVNECFKCSDPNVGFSLTSDRNFVKCYMGDTGLLVSHAFSENEIVEDELYKEIINDKLELNEGMIYENAISQILTSNGHKLFFYTEYDEISHRNSIEIDFLISNNSKLKYKIFPIEVKSTKKYQFNSLKKFTKKYKSRIGESFIVHPKNLAIKTDEESGLSYTAIPPYMAICL